MNCESYLTRVLLLVDELRELADEEGRGCDHDSCLLLGGVIRDCAARIRNVAEYGQRQLVGAET